MKKKLLILLLAGAMIITSLAGCGSTSSGKEEVIQTQNNAMDANTEVEVTTEEETVTKEAKANEYYEAGRACLYRLDGAEINLEDAYNNFEKAVELGKVDANFYLGLLCDWYNYPKTDYEMAKNYYEKCENNPYANINMGLLYLNGCGVDEDKEKAKEIFQTVIEQGYIEGYYGNACIAYEEEDYNAAYEYLNKVVEEGTEQLYIADAMVGVGSLYCDGYCVEQDFAKALELYTKALDLGSVEAMSNMGMLYDNGAGVEQDYAKALEWYEKAVALGSKTGMNNIGVMYYFGNGVEQSYEKALEWCEKAAALGNKTAEANAEAIRKRMQ